MWISFLSFPPKNLASFSAHLTQLNLVSPSLQWNFRTKNCPQAASPRKPCQVFTLIIAINLWKCPKLLSAAFLGSWEWVVHRIVNFTADIVSPHNRVKGRLISSKFKTLTLNICPTFLKTMFLSLDFYNIGDCYSLFLLLQPQQIAYKMVPSIHRQPTSS